jgi:hypothetical protein
MAVGTAVFVAVVVGTSVAVATAVGVGRGVLDAVAVGGRTSVGTMRRVGVGATV